MHNIEGSSSIKGLEMTGDTLRVHFVSGKSYDYEDVGSDTLYKMLNAKSAGSFFAREIRPNFKGVLVNEEE